ncbi:hypothetical protein NITMOv2_1257 [Nitrospira moscoviensis]|uniref:Uncharacterized protein n=1 Tax=Nitrospira moscoviensis TaxID=42253 RepID=A0A0K2G9R7_NITMO|nr:hypothetical protein NITMOv2_1257 [Nitrospira moscoviensis]
MDQMLIGTPPLKIQSLNPSTCHSYGLTKRNDTTNRWLRSINKSAARHSWRCRHCIRL